MAHDLDFSKNKAAFVAFQKSAWHGLGTIMQDAISVQDALIKGGLDYEVVKLPNIHYLPNDEEIVSNTSFFTCRMDTFGVLGDRLGKDYEVFQNEQCLNIADEILQAGRASIETAGAIDGGRKVFICLKVNQDIRVGFNDVVSQYVVFATSHDGSMSITCIPTNIRVVCQNTLSAALSRAVGAIKIRHSGMADYRIKEASKVLGLISTNTDINTENYNRMKETRIEPAQMFDYFGNIFCTKEEIEKMNKGAKFTDIVSTKKQNVLKDVLAFSNNGIGQSLALDGGGLNMWAAYNAVTGYLTGKKYSSASDRAESMLFGSTAKMVESAGALALAPELVKPLKKVQSFGFSDN